MSVIAWDGYTLAADRRACMGGLYRTTTKIFRVGRLLVGFAGGASYGMEMLAWIKSGVEPERFPSVQRDRGNDEASGILVIRENREIARYELTPYPVVFSDRHFAIGSGRDFALAAMHCGRTAEEAVKVACLFDVYCGNGVDTLTLSALERTEPHGAAPPHTTD